MRGWEWNMLAEIVYDGHLSGAAVAILVGMGLLIIGGLSWCFYRALNAAGQNAGEQYPDEE